MNGTQISSGTATDVGNGGGFKLNGSGIADLVITIVSDTQISILDNSKISYNGTQIPLEAGTKTVEIIYNEPELINPPSSGGGTTVSETTVKITNASVYLYPNLTTPITGTAYDGDYSEYISDDFTNPILKILNGKFTIDLGIPINLGTWTSSIAVPSNVKTYGVSSFMSDLNDLSLVKNLLEDNAFAFFIYADKNAKLNGVEEEVIWPGDEDEYNVYHTFNNITLKKGWNTILFDLTDDNIILYSNITLDSSYKWVLW